MYHVHAVIVQLPDFTIQLNLIIEVGHHMHVEIIDKGDKILIFAK